MQSLPRCFLAAACALFLSAFASAQTPPPKSRPAQPVPACSLYPVGTEVPQPANLRSKSGELRVALTIKNSPGADGHMRFCYVDELGNVAPTLRLNQGDTLILTLHNAMTPPPSAVQKALPHLLHGQSAQKKDPCAGRPMTLYSANLHFHGLSVPAVCHQDETLKTLIQPGDPPFEYHIRIPATQPPGLYWYHPHVHGFSEEQLLGGASGAIIIEGVERANPQVAGLAERVLVVRDHQMPSSFDKPDPNRPTKQLSINYVPVPFPDYPAPLLNMKPNERQFWRVVNASADTYLDLRLQFAGKSQNLSLIAMDGVPLRYDEGASKDYAPEQTRVFLPPAGRAEFIVSAPPAGVSAQLVTSAVYRGAGDEDGTPVRVSGAQPGVRVGQDDVDPTRPLAMLVTSENSQAPSFVPAASPQVPASSPSAPLSSIRPARKRTLFFSEKLVEPGNPNSATLFFITQAGQTPAVFDPATEPAITVRSGEVEEWTIENRSLESHDFHVHQLHFLVVSAFGVMWEEPSLRDTINLPAWSGRGRYPSVTLRMDFRNPDIVGTFPFHCHIMQHIDGGMMGTVRVEPAHSTGN
jgi:FtsP/CotA-like multicopper oxidase with cupredoxin domain